MAAASPIFRVAQKLTVRIGQELESDKVEEVVAGTGVTVLEQVVLADGKTRARIALMGASAPLGWVSTEKDGKDLLIPAGDEEEVEGAATPGTPPPPPP